MPYLNLPRALLLLVLLALPLRPGDVPLAQAEPPTHAQTLYRDGELLVKFKDAQAARAAAVHGMLGARRLAGGARWLHRVELPAGMSVDAARRWYEGRPEVEYAVPNYLVRKATVPNDPHFLQQWGLYNTGQTVNGITGAAGVDIGAPSAWERHVGDGAVIVAVLDTGIDYQHPDLADNVVAGKDFANGDDDPMDDDADGHGTHVAGIIGARGNNGVGVAGVNWRVKLMPLKVLRADGYGDTAAIVAAIDHAIAQGARIINASYAYPCGAALVRPELEALQRAQSAGVLVVAAAGNDACDNDVAPTYPASHPLNNLLSVGASDAYDGRASFGRASASSIGARSVHLFAPGKNIYSTVRMSLGGYAFEDGTSMAAPHVSGAAALLMSYRPTLGMREVREILLKSARPRETLRGLAVTGGRLDLAGALAMDLNAQTPVQPSHLRATRRDDRRIDLTWVDDSTIETGYRVEWRGDPANETYTPLQGLRADATSFAHEPVDAGEGTYNGYRVYAVNARGDSAATAEVRIVQRPAAPTGLAASLSGQTVILTWADNSRHESSYRVERAKGNGAFVEIASLPANTQRHEDAGLEFGSEYHYRVRAHNAATGFSQPSATVSVTPREEREERGGTQVGCFIATAAYGSALHPKVEALRRFRDHVLLPNALGRALVQTYYRASPALARQVAERAWLRQVVRALLWPVVLLAQWWVPEAQAGAFFKPGKESDVTEALPAERQALVKFNPSVDDAARERVLRARGALHWRQLHGPLYVVEFADRPTRDQALAPLAAQPEVEYAEPNQVAGRPRVR